MEKQDLASAHRRLRCANRKTRKRALKIIQQAKREKKKRLLAISSAN